jgi:hypothetical protein
MGVLLVAFVGCGGGGSGSSSTSGLVPGNSATPTPSASDTPTPHPTASATPSSTPSVPPWDASHHTNYFAIVYGDGNNGSQSISLFAPGFATPSATITYACCIGQIAFDAQANLVAAHYSDGLLVFAPGASSPTRVLAAQSGFGIATDGLGDYAIGGYNQGSNVEIYPGGSTNGDYALPGQVNEGGIALSTSGEIAVPISNGEVQTYPRESQTPNRTLPVNLLGGGGVNVALLTYDSSGNLAVAAITSQSVSLYSPSSIAPSYTIGGFGHVQWIRFDPANRLYVGDTSSVNVYAAGSSTLLKTISTPRTAGFDVNGEGDIAVAGYTSASEIYPASGGTLSLNLPYAASVAASP